MNVTELHKHLYDLSPVERQRLQTGEEVPSAFYAALDGHGLGPSPDGVYQISMEAGGIGKALPLEDETVYGRLHSSPLQDEMFIKKASRFYHEPFARCKEVCIRYVHSGESAMRTLDEEISLVAGDLCLLAGGFALSQYLDKPEDLVFTLIFRNDYLIRNVIERVRESNVVSRFCRSHVMQARYPQNYVLFHGGQNPRIRPTVERMLCEYIDPDEYSRGAVEALVAQLVYEMLRCPYEFDETPAATREMAIARLVDHVDRHFANVTLRDLSERFGYTQKYVSRLFKRATGHTLKAYVTKRRMRHAAALLQGTTLTVQEVATECGLQNMTHFYRQFSETFECTPKEYRREHATP